MRGWLTPETYRQSQRSLIREAVVLAALQAEAAGSLVRDYTLAKSAFAPAVAGDMHRVQAFMREIERQLVSSYEIQQMNERPEATDTSSVDALVRLHNAMIEAGMIKRKQESETPAPETPPAAPAHG